MWIFEQYSNDILIIDAIHGTISHGCMSKSTDEGTIPKSVRHKRILSLAEDRPDASLEALADEIPTATVDLIEHVLEQYGDPASNEDGDPPDGSSQTPDMATNDSTDESNAGVESMEEAPPDDADSDTTDPSVHSPNNQDETDGDGEESESADLPSASELTDIERETLALIRENPTATQRELGDILGVSPATISNRVNAIRGFEWGDRASLVDEILADTNPNEYSNHMAAENVTVTDQLETIADRLDALEARLDDRSAPSEPESIFADSELIHKVIHACMESDHLSEEEELQVIRDVLQYTRVE